MTKSLLTNVAKKLTMLLFVFLKQRNLEMIQFHHGHRQMHCNKTGLQLDAYNEIKGITENRNDLKMMENPLGKSIQYQSKYSHQIQFHEFELPE